jgi:Zn-dependent protease
MRVARVVGIPIRLHWSFLGLMAVFLVASFWTQGAAALAETAALMVALFGSVVLHELGHALSARAFGVQTAHITLYPFGGVAAITGLPSKPWQELVIAVAGPAVNFAIFGVVGLGYAATGYEPLMYLSGLNLLMGVFNLIPAFPMDGGRVLRAALAGPMGYVPASRLALNLGRMFAWMFLMGGFGLTWSGYGGLNLALVGVFLHLAVTAERRRLEWLVERASYEAWRRRNAVYLPRWRLAPEV